MKEAMKGLRVKRKYNPGGAACHVLSTVTIQHGLQVYLFEDGNWGYASDYEPIPETRWVDVTAECTVLLGCNEICHGQVRVSGYASLDYRLVKVKRGDYRPNEDCFLIEKQEPA